MLSSTSTLHALVRSHGSKLIEAIEAKARMWVLWVFVGNAEIAAKRIRMG